MHLEIILSKDRIEDLGNSQVVLKLYDLTYENEDLAIVRLIDSTSVIKGNIRVNAAYLNLLEYLTQTLKEEDPGKFDILITASSVYIHFKDRNVELILINAGIGDGTGITLTDAATAEIGEALRNKTNITSFDEFKYFTKCNTNPGSNFYFDGCTNLASIDLTNCTSIRDTQFSKTALTTINIPNLLSVAGYNHFKNCTSLTTILSLGNITTIEDHMFDGCSSLLTINFPQSCTTVDIYAFSGCTNLSLDVSELSNIVKISNSAFVNCYSLYGNLNLPKLTSMGTFAFNKCYRITNIECLGTIATIPNGMKTNRDAPGTSGLISVYIPYECTAIGSEAFRGNDAAFTTIKQYNKSILEYEEGETPIYNPISRVTSFGNLCFYRCNLLLLTNDDVCNAVTIGSEAFRETSIRGNLILNNLTSIGDRAFQGCASLTGVDFSNSTITELPNFCFDGDSNLTTINLPSTCKTLGYAFIDCSNLQISLNDLINVETIRGLHDNYLFSFYNKTNAPLLQNASTLYLPNLKNLGMGAFFNLRGITTVNLPALTTMYATGVFRGCTNLQLVLSLGNITEFYCGDYTYNKYGVFDGCSSLTKVVLPNVRNLPLRIFYNCTSLSDLNIPTSITSIGGMVFHNTNSLTNKVMYFPNVTKINCLYTFANSAGMHIYLPGLLLYAKEHTNNNNFVTTGESVYPETDGTGDVSSMFSHNRSSAVVNPYVRVLYLKDITTIPMAMFYGANIDMVIINNTTIPTLFDLRNSGILNYNNGNNTFLRIPNLTTLIFAGATNIGALYVPDAALLSYIDSSLFADLAAANKIKALSTCPRVTVAQAEAGNNGIIEDYM